MSKKQKQPQQQKKEVPVEIEKEDRPSGISEAFLQKINDIQKKIEKVYENNSIKVLEIEKNFNDKLQGHYTKRNALIESTKGLDKFWSEVVVKTFIDSFDNQDQEVCDAIKKLECQTEFNLKDGFSKKTVRIFFSENSIFTNKTLEKTVTFTSDGEVKSTSTLVDLKKKPTPPPSKSPAKGAKKDNKRKEIEQESLLVKFFQDNENPDFYLELFEDFMKMYEDPFSVALGEEDDEDEDEDIEFEEGDDSDDDDDDDDQEEK